MNPTTAIAQVIATFILSETCQKDKEELKEKRNDLISLLITTIREKLRQTGTEGLIDRIEKQPIEKNRQILAEQIILEMNEDYDFYQKVQGLLNQIREEVLTVTNSQLSNNYNIAVKDEFKGVVIGDKSTVYNKWIDTFNWLAKQDQTIQKSSNAEKLSWEQTYKEMSQENEDWSSFEIAIADGLEGEI